MTEHRIVQLPMTEEELLLVNHCMAFSMFVMMDDVARAAECLGTIKTQLQETGIDDYLSLQEKVVLLARTAFPEIPHHEVK